MEAKFWISGPIIGVVVWLGMTGSAMALPNIGHISHTCTGVHDPYSDYQAALDVVVPRIIRRTATRNYDYYTLHRIRRTVAYARGVCSLQISVEDCRVCLRVADRYLYDSCRFPTRAYIQLVDCQMKYQDRAFSRIP